jgi:hypothetical protein
MPDALAHTSIHAEPPSHASSVLMPCNAMLPARELLCQLVSGPWLVDDAQRERRKKPLIYAAATGYARGISPLSRSRECIRHEVIRDASHTYTHTSSTTTTTTRHPASQGDLHVWRSSNAGVDLSPSWARASKRQSTAQTKVDSSSQRRSACAWLSLYRSRELL